MKKLIAALVLVITFPISGYANSDWIPAQVITPPVVVQIQPVPVYRWVTRVEPRLVPNVILSPMPVQKVGVFGRVISETIVMQPITVYQWQNITVQSWEPVLP